MRYDKRKYCRIIVDDIKYIPMYLLFFGSIQYHLFKVVMDYVFCPKHKSKMRWGSTAKEVGATSKNKRCTAFVNTLDKHKDVYIFFGLTVLVMIFIATPLVPIEWRINSYEAFVPLALLCGFHMLSPILLNPYITSGTVYLNN